MLSINNNSSSLSLMNGLQKISKNKNQSLNELSSGKKNSGGVTDIVSLSSASQLESAIRGLESANNNISYSSSVVDTASGGLNQTLSNLQNLRDLAVQAADDTLSATERSSLQGAASNSLASIDSTASSTSAGDLELLDGSFGTRSIQVGADAGEQVSITIDSASTAALGMNAVDLSSASSAGEAITAIDQAIEQVTSEMASLGSSSQRLDNVESANRDQIVNLASAKSNVEDIDVAKTAAKLVGQNIMQEAAISLFTAMNKQKKSTFSTLV